MPIEILLPPEPFAPASRKDETIVIRSAGYRQLHRELLRYCRGEVEGRSFLIAGHRGAGKTTMVNDVVLQVEKAASDADSRPIIVRLHGPNLVRPEAGETRAATNAKQPANGEAAESDNGKKKQPGNKTGEAAEAERAALADEEQQETETSSDMKAVQRALKQITLSLHCAVVKEITKCYRDRVGDERDERRRNELYERAAQLELATDQYPLPDELRDYWRAGGFLQRGVLFRGERRAPDQGFRELVAVASVTQAYARVAGILKSELSQSSDDLSRTTMGTGKGAVDLIGPITSVLTGGLTGTALFAGANQSLVASAVTGLITAFGAANVFKYSNVRSRKRTYSTGLTFLPDLRVSTLDRVLPVLIDRIRSAGLVPVFVVDELDKIPGLYGELEGIVRHVKNIVAERAFFCFLTDRNYYERVVQVNVFDPYPKHYTYYTDRVFVSFQTDDLHTYLGDILRPAANASASTPATVQAPAVEKPASSPLANRLLRTREASAVSSASASASPSQPTPAPSAPAASTIDDDEDRRDLEVLRYVVLRRSELHAIEIRRQLSVWRDRANPVLINTAGVRSYSAYRFDLLVQFAVEVILHREEVADRLRHDPALGRLLYDALYYPVRLLGRNAGKENGGSPQPRFELRLDDTSMIQRFVPYLIERMSSDREGEKHEQERKVETNSDLPDLGVEGVDVDFLYAQMRDLVGVLADPFALMDELASEKNRMPQPSSTIMQALPLNPSSGPLLRRVSDKVYEWRYGANWNFRDDLVRSGTETRRSNLARQLDLYLNLAVRLALASDEARPLVGDSEQRKAELHANLLEMLQRKWLSESYEFPASELTAVGSSMANARPVIEVLGRILSEHNEYSHRLSASNLRERYEPVRSTFSIRHAPLIALKRAVWSFQYDRDGNPRAEKLEAAHWGDLSGRWERNLDYILAVTGALDTLRSISPQPTETALDPGYLSVTLQVLRTTPSWRDVEPAVKRLTEFRSTRRFYNKFDEDAATIAAYIGEVLLPGHDVLLNAVFVGTIIGRAATQNFHDAAVKALTVMSAAYWSRSDAGEPADVTLERISSLLEHRWPALGKKRKELRDQLVNSAESAGSDQISIWNAVVSDLCATVEKEVQFSDAERAKFVAGAWDEWRRYFAERYPKTSFVPGVDNLFCRVAQVGPGMLLPDQPRTMSLLQWSDVYVRATINNPPTDPKYAPAWLALFARAELGLRTALSTATDLAAEAPQAFSSEELKQVTVNEPTRHPVLKRALIIRNAESSATIDWSIPAGYGVLVLTAKELVDLAGNQTRALSSAKLLDSIGEVDHIFIEAGVDGVIGVLDSDYIFRSRPPITLFGERTSKPDWAARVVSTPANALQLVRTSDALPVAAAADLPKPIADLWNPSAGVIGQVETRTEQLIVFNLRTAQNTPNELVIRSRTGERTSTLEFAQGQLRRTGLLVRRRYRITFDGVTLRLEQTTASLTAIDALVPPFLQSWLVSRIVGRDSLEMAAGATPTEWRVEYRSTPGLLGSASGDRRASALLIVRSTRVQ